MSKQPIRWLGSLAIILVILISCELLAFLATLVLQHRNIIFCPLHITEPYEMYQKRFLPNLGWPTPDFAHQKPDFYDASGSRIIPAYPDPFQTPPRLSLYGDSFTEAWGVSNEQAWGNVLSLRLHCRVSNFGIAGYGTDQAYLRFLQNTQDPAKVVVLGIFTENIKRNINQLRNLISTVQVCQTKPRFILNDQGQLTLVPIPTLSASEYYDIQYHPGRYFNHEFFLPDGPSGLQMAEFPYLWGMIKASRFILKNLGHLDEISKYRYLYQPGHPSQALEVMTAIITAFCDSAHKRGKRPVVMIIPTQEDMVFYQRHHKWSYLPLLNGLKASGLEYIDAGPGIARQLNGADPKTLYDPKLSFHLTPEGNQLLASIFYNFLTSRNILGQIQ